MNAIGTQLRDTINSGLTDLIAYITSISFSLSVENNQADVEQDGRTRLARPNSWARVGTGKYPFSGDRKIFISPVHDHEQVGNRLIYTPLFKVCDDYTHIHAVHTYIHTIQ